MRVITDTQKALTIAGLHFLYSEKHWWYKLYASFAFTVLCMMFQPQLTYFIVNIYDIIRATDAFVQVSTEAMTIGKALTFYWHRKLVCRLLRRMQHDYDWPADQLGKTTADTSKDDANELLHAKCAEHFRTTNREASFVTNINITLIWMSIFAYCGGPLAVIAFHHWMGTLRPEMWIHPFKGVFLFDYKNSPGYELGYVLNIMYNYYLGTFFTAIDTFYVGLCLYAIAKLNCLKDYLLDVDQKWSDGQLSDAELESRLINGIRIHYDILALIENISMLTSGIVLAQFSGVVFILSTITYQTTVSEGTAIVFYLVPAVAILWQFFLYCFYGNQLTHKSFEVNEAIYQTRWYTYPRKYQKYFGKMMLRMQRPFILSGFGYVNCSLQSFTAVLKFVGSVIALFQSMEVKI